ncbi:hypothetical protein OG923_00720 [Streptomyces halstedii]|uniref:hypothetical protein n=1 Tax=Streptomyces halstedii TaxID=1944 RepID=UPI0032552EB0
MTVLLSGWLVLTAVERWAEQAPWPDAVAAGLLWACVVAGVWWFAEWTQSPLRAARLRRTPTRRDDRTTGDSTGDDGTPRDGVRGRHAAVEPPDPHPRPRNPSAPSHR